MELQESGQMYLESILILQQKMEKVRSIDVVRHMNLSRPSVSRAVHLLEKNHFLSVEGDGSLVLTKEGERIAKQIYERHTVLTAALVNLGVDEKTAAEDACRLEHYISDASMNAIKKHMAAVSPGVLT